MEKDRMMSCLTYKALMTFIDKEAKKEKTRFLGGCPYTTDPHDKNLDFLTQINLGAEFVLRVMNERGPVKQSVEAVKSYLRTSHFTNMRELAENTESFLFKTAFCAPAKYIPLLVEAGLDVNATRCHPIYTNIKDGEKYPLLVFAAEIGDGEKIKALIENGADKSVGPTAADLCKKSDVLSPAEKADIMNKMRAFGMDVFEKKKADNSLAEFNKATQEIVNKTVKNPKTRKRITNLWVRAFGRPSKERD